MTAPIAVVSGAATDAGRWRTLNEDAHLASAPAFLVADGMGGHEAGELASAAVIAEFTGLAGRPSASVDDVREALDRARAVVRTISGGAAGTTLGGVVVADVDGDGYWLTVNVGDSRTYLLRDRSFEQISVDHSVVQELVDSGELLPHEALRDARRNVITRAIGAGSDAEPDFWMLPAERGDRILVCSDGLPGELDPARIEAVLRAEGDPQAAAARLVREAIVEGGRDNITALVVDAVTVVTQEVGDTIPTLDEDTRPREGDAVRGGR